jgi:hypothetical protein
MSSMSARPVPEFPRVLAKARAGYKEPLLSQLGGSGEPHFLPGFQRFREVLAGSLSQRTEAISLPGSPRRASIPARAAALSDWLFSFALPRRCAGESAGSKSRLQTGTTRSGTESPGRGHQ